MRIPKQKPLPIAGTSPDGNMKSDIDRIANGIDKQIAMEKVVADAIAKEMNRPIPIKLDVSSEKILDKLQAQFLEQAKTLLERSHKKFLQELDEQKDSMLDRIRLNKGVWLSDKLFLIWLSASSVMLVMSILSIVLLIKVYL